MINCPDIYKTKDFQYIQIQKNGCSSVRDLIYKNYSDVESHDSFLHNDRVSFAVLRDPWERTISGLAYDMQAHLGRIDLDLIDKRLFFSRVCEERREVGMVSHCILQSIYLFDFNPTFYVMLSDLSTFLEMHFGESVKVNRGSDQFKNELIRQLRKRPDLVERIGNYIEMDNFLIERIRNKEILWNFTLGRMW